MLGGREPTILFSRNDFPVPWREKQQVNVNGWGLPRGADESLQGSSPAEPVKKMLFPLLTAPSTASCSAESLAEGRLWARGTCGTGGVSGEGRAAPGAAPEPRDSPRQGAPPALGRRGDGRGRTARPAPAPG